MKKKEYLIIALIILLFLVFTATQLFKGSSCDVLRVISPFKVAIDKNNNGLVDDGEILSIKSDLEYIDKNNVSKFTYLNLDNKTLYTLAYLTEKYVNDILIDRKIEILKHNNTEDLIIDKNDYINILKKSGYFFQNGQPVNQEIFKQRLTQINKSDYKIYNLKSNIYHSPDCEYGRKSHNYILLAKSQLPKGAKPCKYCIGDKLLKTKNQTPNLLFVSGPIKVILNDYTNHLIPNRFGNSKMCNELISQINSAKSTIDIATYGYDRVPKIEKAIKQAISRGVIVRLVYDIDNKNENIYPHTFDLTNIIKNNSCDISKEYGSNYSKAIMHNKFYIFDNSRVITGSANLSYTDMSDFNSNCMIFINSKQIAQIYTQEFEQMYHNKFHKLKTKILNKENIKLDNSVISVYFSPQDNIIDTVFIPIIHNAQKYIYIPVFLITHKGLTQALIRAKQRGVVVKVIVDATNAKNQYSTHNQLRKNGILTKTENYAGKLHSKSMIVDDKYTIIGSMNFSKSGNSYNDENVLVIKNTQLTKFYKKYFEYTWNKINDYWLKHDVSAESKYSIGSCSDKIDNDYDGKVDMEDEGCRAKNKYYVNTLK